MCSICPICRTALNSSSLLNITCQQRWIGLGHINLWERERWSRAWPCNNHNSARKPAWEPLQLPFAPLAAPLRQAWRSRNASYGWSISLKVSAVTKHRYMDWKGPRRLLLSFLSLASLSLCPHINSSWKTCIETTCRDQSHSRTEIQGLSLHSLPSLNQQAFFTVVTALRATPPECDHAHLF